MAFSSTFLQIEVKVSMKLVAIRNEKVVPLATWPIRLQLHVVFAGAASAQTVPCCPFALRLNFTLTLVRRPINDKQYMSSLSFFRSNLSAAPNLPTTYLLLLAHHSLAPTPRFFFPTRSLLFLLHNRSISSCYKKI